jgi:elongation factor Ts
MTDEDASEAERILHAYAHPGGRLAALVDVRCETTGAVERADLLAVAHELAMHVAAVAPVYRTRDEVPDDVLANECDVWNALADRAGLAGDERVAFLQARKDRFYAQVCLMEQPFIKDMTTTVADLLADYRQQLGAHITVERFVRYQLGELEVRPSITRAHADDVVRQQGDNHGRG